MPRSSAHSALVATLLFSLVLFVFANGDHAFPKRRILQDSSSTSSSGGDSSTSTSSFSNTVTGTDDSPDRVEVSPAVSLAESPLSDAELCAVSKQIYGSVPAECANQPQLKVRSLPVKVGPVEEPLSLGVDSEGAITASGGNPPDVDAADWNPVTGEPLSKSSSSSKKLSLGAVAGIIVGVVAVFVAGVAAVAVSRKRRSACSATGLAAARAGTSSSSR